jgi:hypothetical protein
MSDEFDHQVFLQHLQARLTQKPHQHIISHVLLGMPGLPEYDGFGFGRRFEPVAHSFMELTDSTIQKISLSADISLYDERGKHFENDIKDCHFEFYLLRYNDLYDSAYWMLMDLSDLLFYLNRLENTLAAQQFKFPVLASCDSAINGFDFISAGREFRNKYFDTYEGPVFDLYFGDELKELFAIASNGLAFLYRTRDRAIQELELTPNHYFSAQINIYPRFNNCIAEVAGTLYAAWERIAFLLQEFFPSAQNPKMPHSFKRYINDKAKYAVKDARLLNTDLTWFDQRINADHLRLEELRHPTVHYNDTRTPTGTRAVELMKSSMDEQSIAATKKAWNEELKFLKDEMKAFDEGLEHSISLLNAWANSLGMVAAV